MTKKKSKCCETSSIGCEISGVDKIQVLMQLYDKQLVSAKTLLREVGLDSEKEALQYKKELKATTKK